MPASDLSSLARIRNVRTRSISAENPDGSAGGGGRSVDGVNKEAARDLGPGWKINPFTMLEPNSVFEFATIDGPGRITHIWTTVDADDWRSLILRFYWDGDTEPAVEVPYGDFFCQGFARFAQINSQPISANTNGGLNSYWPMPFHTGARLTVENLKGEPVIFFYQVTYEVGDDTTDEAYLHAQWRRSNPLAYKVPHVLVEGIEGHGQYVGCYLAWGVNSNGWWGEGEVKFYLDDDREYPTICGTGTEDYFGGAWAFATREDGYVAYSTPYLGMPQVIKPDGLFAAQTRFGLYRWHVLDPIHFDHRLGRVDIQALGWRNARRYMPLQDDIASTTFFYLDRTSAHRPPAPTADELEVFHGMTPAPGVPL